MFWARRPSAGSWISVLELTRLAEMGRVQVKLSLDEWLERSLRTLQAQLLPVDTEVALEAARLPEPQPPDVADRILLATARVHDCELVTADDGLLAQTAARLRDARL
jgi:PIN domain nuclease of toxin-antitoxin system